MYNCMIHADMIWASRQTTTQRDPWNAHFQPCVHVQFYPQAVLIASKRLGSQHSPVLNIEPDNVIIDELHLFLRIGDVFIRNLVFELVQTGRKSSTAIATHLTALLSSARECGVTFHAWECRDPYGKPSGKYDLLWARTWKRCSVSCPHISTVYRGEKLVASWHNSGRYNTQNIFVRDCNTILNKTGLLFPIQAYF